MTRQTLMDLKRGDRIRLPAFGNKIVVVDRIFAKPLLIETRTLEGESFATIREDDAPYVELAP